MDIEKLIESLQNAAGGPEGIKMCHAAATALSTLQTENKKLRAELENYRKGHREEAISTLTPPNEPLTLEELREMDEPVWGACKPIEGGNGYWCLCQHGHIITPAGSIYDVKEIPHWVFYRRPLEGAEDGNV